MINRGKGRIYYNFYSISLIEKSFWWVWRVITRDFMNPRYLLSAIKALILLIKVQFMYDVWCFMHLDHFKHLTMAVALWLWRELCIYTAITRHSLNTISKRLKFIQRHAYFRLGTILKPSSCFDFAINNPRISQSVEIKLSTPRFLPNFFKICVHTSQ